jgi:hypothetical protein
MNWTDLAHKESIGVVTSKSVWVKFGDKFGDKSRTAYVDAFMEAALTPGNLHVLGEFCKHIMDNLNGNGMRVVKSENSELWDGVAIWLQKDASMRFGLTSTLRIDVKKTAKVLHETKVYFQKYYNITLCASSSQIVSAIVCFMANNEHMVQIIFPEVKK